LAASIMILKLMLQPWMTVLRMMKVGAGFRSPEDAKKSPLHPLFELKKAYGKF
jgi:glutathione S-transferase